MNRALVVLGGLALALGGVAAAGILLAADSLTGDDESAAAPPATPTPEPTPDARQAFLEDFAPIGCQLMDFTTKLNEWTAAAQERGDRLDILGGIGFWREFLAGIDRQVAGLPASQRELRTAATGYVAALDDYLATLGEFWFTAQEPSGQAAADRLAFAEQQGMVLQAEAEEAAGGPFTLRCPQPR